MKNQGVRVVKIPWLAEGFQKSIAQAGKWWPAPHKEAMSGTIDVGSGR